MILSTDSILQVLIILASVKVKVLSKQLSKQHRNTVLTPVVHLLLSVVINIIINLLKNSRNSGESITSCYSQLVGLQDLVLLK